MAVPFFGGECEAFARTSTNVTESTTGGSYDSTVARCAIRIGNLVTDYAESPAFGSLTTLWVHFEFYQATTVSANPILVLVNNAGTPVFRITCTVVGGTFQCQYWNGSAWTNIGGTFIMGASSRYTVDLKLVCGASGSFELYTDNELRVSGSASMGSVTDVDKLRLCNNGDGGFGAARQPHFSQIIVMTTTSIQHKLVLKPPSGNSATNTAWTGDFNDVDETVLSDADFISSSSSGQAESFTHASITLPTGSVKAVGVSARIRTDGSPANVKGLLRIGSSNYLSGNLPIGAGFTPGVAIWEQDPSTAAAWTNANAISTAMEFGLESAS